jgi:UDP-N-acetylglucosamine diphosphorylase / glucose-1-phosphate thymidylyltransferase / UDP-N-acetylgalactosamine diphosphorylase / glucosamine-1-phosphate N-acetyltransferase / galactosamine-1-phosphate N-acetyltransferase
MGGLRYNSGCGFYFIPDRLIYIKENSMAQMPILIILAGGASSRMWPLREKSLLRFGTESLLVSQLHRYRALGFQEAVIVTNPENQADITKLTGQITTMDIRLAVQPEPKGMGDALLRAESALANRPGSSVYINQVHDVVDDKLHLDLLAAYNADPTITYLAGYAMEDYFPGGYLVVNAQGQISGIIEKPPPDQRPSNLVSIVAHVHPDAGRLFEALRAQYASNNAADDHYERAMDSLMKQHIFRVVPYSGHWSALKYPWHVLDVMGYYLSQIKGQNIAESAFIAPTAMISGDVYIGERVKIFPGAAVVGPAYIGADTVIGNNALVRGSMVLNHCEVGFTTEVARSYVADHCSMHACRVLDSVFAPNVNFSAGCTTANLRIDKGHVSSIVKGAKLNTGRDKLGAVVGQDAFIGVDALTMPGVKIGERAQIGPGTHVRYDVKNGQRVYVKQEIQIVESADNS